MKGLLDRFEGLVLLGLGPPAISSFVVALLGVPCWEQRGAVEAAAARGARRADGAASRSVRIAGEHCRGGLSGGCCLGVKQLRNVVMPGQLLAGAAGKVEVAREKAGDWRVAQGRPRIRESRRAASLGSRRKGWVQRCVCGRVDSYRRVGERRRAADGERLGLIWALARDAWERRMGVLSRTRSGADGKECACSDGCSDNWETFWWRMQAEANDGDA